MMLSRPQSIDPNPFIYIFACAFIFHAIVGQDFAPTLLSRCFNGRLVLRVTTTTPFNGIVHSSGRARDCYANGTGQITTIFSIALTDIERCNIVYDPTNELYSVQIEVHEHRAIIVQQDRFFNITCGSTIKNNDTTTTNEIKLAVKMKSEEEDASSTFHLAILDGDHRMHELVFGRPYTVQMSLNSPGGERRFRVVDCWAFGGSEDRAALLDDVGCPMDHRLISSFQFSSAGNNNIAHILAMFRFSDTQMVHIQCAAEFCSKDDCEVPCGNSTNDVFTSDLGNALLRQIRDPRLTNADRHFASTTVRVIDQAFPAKANQLSSVDIDGTELPCIADNETLTVVCAVLGGLLLVGTIVNVAFCFASGAFRSPPSRPESLSLDDTSKRALGRRQRSEFWITDQNSHGRTDKLSIPVRSESHSHSISNGHYFQSAEIPYASVRKKVASPTCPAHLDSLFAHGADNHCSCVNCMSASVQQDSDSTAESRRRSEPPASLDAESLQHAELHEQQHRAIRYHRQSPPPLPAVKVLQSRRPPTTQIHTYRIL